MIVEGVGFSMYAVKLPVMNHVSKASNKVKEVQESSGYLSTLEESFL